MFVEISNVSFSYNDQNIENVTVNFNGRNERTSKGSVYVNGNIRLSEEEYRGNESLDVLADMAKDYVIEQIQKEQIEDPENEDDSL